MTEKYTDKDDFTTITNVLTHTSSDPADDTSSQEKFDEKTGATGYEKPVEVDEAIAHDIGITAEDYEQAAEFARGLSLEMTFKIMKDVIDIHEYDPNFSVKVINNARKFLDNKTEITVNPEEHTKLINEMKIEAALISNNSPYAEVRAVVDNYDDPTLPSSTIRAWFIGIIFVCGGAFINQLFSVRQPAIAVGSNVAQLLAFPVGKAMEKVLPDVGVTVWGVRHSLNPGKFNRKEHMLITIMANVGFNVPYTDYIIWSQFLPTFFNQSYAGGFAYQILIGLGTNFIGYSVAGLLQRFLVEPAHLVWPSSLVTIALNRSFHTEANVPVKGPGGKTYSTSRMRCFALCFGGMFVYFFLPNYIFTALSTFNWMTWIAPENKMLTIVTGSVNGLGINPLATLDWNITVFNGDPLVLPFVSIISSAIGATLAGLAILGFWMTNIYDTGYLPMNSNRVFDRFGDRYNVTRILDYRGIFDQERYSAYSRASMSAGNLVIYFNFFAVYGATVSYAVLYHRKEIKMGFTASSLRWKFWVKETPEEKLARQPAYLDVHNRLMSVYPEVSNWWYLATLCFSLACALAGIMGWETYTTPAVVFYGLGLSLIFVIPIGIISAITGVSVTLNVLAEFIGGAWFPGNALSMNFFKAFGYVTTAHALNFSNDMKLAHYVKLPPRHTFMAQMIATFISTFVCTGVLNFQLHKIEDVCTATQKAKFTCPGVNTFFTAAVFWGTLGPPKTFGVHGQYKEILYGFIFGFFIPPIFYLVQRRYRHISWVRQIHPVVLLTGALIWAPYNLSYVWSAVPFSFLSMRYLKTRYLAFWAKYNYVVSASFSTAIALSGIVIFFALQWNEINLDWWGNTVSYEGWEGTVPTWLPFNKTLGFGPAVGEFS